MIHHFWLGIVVFLVVFAVVFYLIYRFIQKRQLVCPVCGHNFTKWFRKKNEEQLDFYKLSLSGQNSWHCSQCEAYVDNTIRSTKRYKKWIEKRTRSERVKQIAKEYNAAIDALNDKKAAL